MEQREIPSIIEKKITPEQTLFTRLGVAVADSIKDVKTASEMAKRKFDGDSAFMHIAKGALTAGVGAGLEVATNAMFDKAWKGEGPIFERFVMGADAGKKLAELARTHPRWSRFVKEGTQDVALAALYNFIAFRSGSIFDQVDATHVMRSLTVDALEAGFLKSIPSEMHKAAGRINEPQPQGNIRTRYRGGFQSEQPYTGPTSDRSGILGKILDLSNPPTQMGLMMISGGLKEFAKNYIEVKKTKKLKKWSGGKVSLPGKGENVYFGNSKNRAFRRKEYDERFEDT